MEEAAMSEYLQQEIKEILEHLDAQEDISASQSDENQQGTEVIDVFVVRRKVEESEPPTVEGTLADTSDEQETQAAPTEQETTELPLPPLPRKARRRASVRHRCILSFPDSCIRYRDLPYHVRTLGNRDDHTDLDANYDDPDGDHRFKQRERCTATGTRQAT
jgi:galactitol-specific phosphotransferase system IIB component